MQLRPQAAMQRDTPSSPVSPFRVSRFSGFSLIELLVVMGILGFVMAIGIGAFQSGSKNMGVTTSASQITNAISGARQLAITRNSRTRFFVVTESSSNPEEWRLQRYGVLKIEDGEVDTGDDANFVLASRVDKLPAGVYFRRAKNNGDESTSVSGSSMFDENLGHISFGGENVEYAYIEFLPSGGTTSTAAANIFEIEKAPSAERSVEGNRNYIRVGVAQYTGRVKFERPDVK